MNADPHSGRESLALYQAAGEEADRHAIVAAARYTLHLFAGSHPGRAVEVRVPPAGVVQVLGGTIHRRGTPPSVVEMGPETWLNLATGKLSWEEADREGLLSASGERSDLSALLPIAELVA